MFLKWLLSWYFLKKNVWRTGLNDPRIYSTSLRCLVIFLKGFMYYDLTGKGDTKEQKENLTHRWILLQIHKMFNYHTNETKKGRIPV